MSKVPGKKSKNPFKVKPKKSNKLGAQSKVVDGIKFMSKAEAKRYVQLKEMQARGEIGGLKLQPEFPLDIWMPQFHIDPRFNQFKKVPVKSNDRRRTKHRGLTYIADFEYFLMPTGEIIVEDVKGMITKDFSIKKALFETIYKMDLRLVRVK